MTGPLPGSGTPAYAYLLTSTLALKIREYKIKLAINIHLMCSVPLLLPFAPLACPCLLLV